MFVRLFCSVVLLAISLSLASMAPAEAQGKGKGKGVGNAQKVVSGQVIRRKGGGDSTAFRVTRSDRILDNGLFATDGFMWAA